MKTQILTVITIKQYNKTYIKNSSSALSTFTVPNTEAALPRWTATDSLKIVVLFHYSR